MYLALHSVTDNKQSNCLQYIIPLSPHHKPTDKSISQGSQQSVISVVYKPPYQLTGSSGPCSISPWLTAQPAAEREKETQGVSNLQLKARAWKWQTSLLLPTHCSELITWHHPTTRGQGRECKPTVYPEVEGTGNIW